MWFVANNFNVDVIVNQAASVHSIWFMYYVLLIFVVRFYVLTLVGVDMCECACVCVCVCVYVLVRMPTTNHFCRAS